MALSKEDIQSLKQDIKRIKPGKERDFAFFERGPGGDPRLILSKMARKEAKAMRKEAGSKPIFGTVSREEEGLSFQTDKPKTLQKSLKQTFGKSVPELKRAKVAKAAKAAKAGPAEEGTVEVSSASGGAGTASPSVLGAAMPAPAPPPQGKTFDGASSEKQREMIIKRFEGATKSYHQAFPSLATQVLGPGWHANLAETVKKMAAMGDYERGCVKTQAATLGAIGALCGRATSKWTCSALKVGSVLEHHAVALYPKGGKPSGGYVLDPWKAGTHEATKSVYTYGDWMKHNAWLNKLAGVTEE